MENQQDYRILIVDDAPENIDILGSILHSYKKSVALNGEKALKLVAGPNVPDLILLDIMMPGMDGFEVCRRLKADPKTKDIPVIFITAKNSVEDETMGLELGAVDFLPKPISPPVVLARVKNQLELLQARADLIKQNRQLSERNTYITDSINYAKRIQTAILPDLQRFRQLFPNSFLIYQPKDIVSGDFYWCGETGNIKIVAAADCTGHGVPGAFMSLIGNTLLNEIIYSERILDPGEILRALDQGIADELNKDKGSETLDGMDITICILNTETGILTYSGANRPLFYFTEQGFNEIKGDHKSIGDNKKKLDYQTYTLNLSEIKSFYLFTDGFIDQLNANNEKFGTRQFRELLLQIQGMHADEQKSRLGEAHKRHMDKEPQLDDITIIGIINN
ncbi:MAG: response regulator [Ignavibacteriaceae bacterium]|nr:response regulator [Ignavibacteriaceae bacterium]